jgi:hypothetical protein
MRKVISKIVSGGQTGVDRAALDVALELDIPCGGWCPKGRRAVDGRIPDRYPLKETPSSGYPQRTEWNVRDSDGTLVLAQDLVAKSKVKGRESSGSPMIIPPWDLALRGGTALTIELARRQKKPLAVANVNGDAIKAVQTWIRGSNIRVLNVAGPRESENRGIYSKTVKFLRLLLKPQSQERKTQSPERKRRGETS